MEKFIQSKGPSRDFHPVFCCPFIPYHCCNAAYSKTLLGGLMAKGDQRNEKMTKKPKKDASVPKNTPSDRPAPPVTAVIPRGKDKDKYK